MRPRVINIRPDAANRYIRFDLLVEHYLDFKNKVGSYFKLRIGNDGPEQYCVVVGEEAAIGTHAPARKLHFMTKPDVGFGQKIGVGTNIELLTEPMGGYDMTGVTIRPIVCFAGGSGIAGIVPVVEAAVKAGCPSIDVFYSETRGEFAMLDRLKGLRKVNVHTMKTEGALSTNPQEPILGMLTALSNAQPIVFMNRPIFYACGTSDFVDRLRSALIPIYATDSDFRLNF